MIETNKQREILQGIANELGEEYKALVDEFSDEQVEKMFREELSDIEIATELTEEARSELSKKLLQLPSNSNSVLVMPPEDYVQSLNESKEKYDGVPIPAKVTVDPVTGKHTYDLMDIIDDKIDTEITLEDIIDEKDNLPNDRYLNTIKTSLGGDIEDSDILEILEFISKVQKEKPKKIYPILPESIKKIINETIPVYNPQHYEMAAREFFNMLNLELSMDKQFIELEEAIKNEVQIPDMTDMYLDHIKDVMEIEIHKRADKLDEIAPEKAKILRDISAAFTDAYTYKTIIDKINNKKKIINKELTKELADYDHYCKKFNAKYKHSKFNISDIRQILYILDRKLPSDISIDSIKKFIILFCKVTRTMTPDNLVHHTYMYYTTRLLEALDHIDSPKTEMSKTIIENITNVIRMIESC